MDSSLASGLSNQFSRDSNTTLAAFFFFIGERFSSKYYRLKASVCWSVSSEAAASIYVKTVPTDITAGTEAVLRAPAIIGSDAKDIIF
ncbi:MAG: hypothetical protein PUK05_01590 [Peptoniphilaceae bacterium]|nr:hypothetical protein [Peptoniphilaceae bacterium]